MDRRQELQHLAGHLILEMQMMVKYQIVITLEIYLNEGSPYDTDGDGIDDASTRDGVQVPYGYSVAGSDGNSTYMNSGPVTLEPGGKDTLIVCTVMGTNLLESEKKC